MTYFALGLIAPLVLFIAYRVAIWAAEEMDKLGRGA